MAGTLKSLPLLDSTIQMKSAHANTWSLLGSIPRAAGSVLAPNSGTPLTQLDGSADLVALVGATLAAWSNLSGYGVLSGFSATAVVTADGANGQEIKTGLAGTISTTTTALTGSGTSFLTDFAVGDVIQLTSGAQSGEARRITAIADNTNATLESAFGANQSGVTYRRGGDAPNTWYCAHAIADSAGVNAAALLLSTRRTSPVLPSGYDLYGHMGSVRLNASSQIVTFRQNGNLHVFDEQQSVFSVVDTDSGGFGNVNPLAPPWATEGLFEVRALTDGSATAAVTTALRRDGASGSGILIASTPAAATRLDRVQGWVPLTSVTGLATVEADKDFPAGATGTSSCHIVAFRDAFVAA